MSTIVSTVPEGSWDAGGRIVGLEDVALAALGDLDAARRFAEKRLSGGCRD